MKDIRYIGVPFRSGCNREGAQLAPSMLCELLKLDMSSCQFLNFASETQPLTDTEICHIKNYASVLDLSHRLCDMVKTTLDTYPHVVTIGGDHSLGLGSVAGALEHDANLGLIWYDAHGDINTEATSPSANAHGMPVAALLGICESDLNTIAKVRLRKENVFWVGARDLDAGEIDILKSLGIWDHVYSTEKVHQLGMKAVMEDICFKMNAQKIEHLHLSFDIDGMDPSIVQATGTKVPNGLTQIEFDEFAASLSILPKLMSMDFVEYNPLMDDENLTTGKWCIQALHKLLK